MKKKMKSKSVYIRLAHKDIASIDVEAKRLGVTRSAVARHAIRAWLRAIERRRAERAAAEIGADMAQVLKQTERIGSIIKAKMDEALKPGDKGARRRAQRQTADSSTRTEQHD